MQTLDTAGAVNLTSAGWTAEGFFTENIDTACMGSPGEVYFFRKDEFITYNIEGLVYLLECYSNIDDIEDTPIETLVVDSTRYYPTTRP